MLAIAVAVGSGCGDDEPEQTSDAATTTEAGEGGLASYCEAIAAYEEATQLDTSTVRSMLDGFEAAARAARAVADRAPAEVRQAHDRLATGSERLAARIREEAPASIEDFIVLADTVTVELEAELGDLEAETDEVTEFARRACDL